METTTIDNKEIVALPSWFITGIPPFLTFILVVLANETFANKA